MPTEHRARRRLLVAGAGYPGLWREVEEQHRAELAGGEVPRSVYVSGSGIGVAVQRWGALTGHEEVMRVNAARAPLQVSCELMALHALAAWRMTLGVYRVDPGLYAALIDTPLDGPLPAHVLTRLPEWSIYVETPGLEAPHLTPQGRPAAVHGAWVTLDHLGPADVAAVEAMRRDVAGTDVPQFRDGLSVSLVFDVDGMEVLPSTYLRLDSTVEASLRLSQQAWTGLGEGHRDDRVRRCIEPVLNLAIYIAWCNDISGTGGMPGNPVPVRTRRHGVKMFPAQAVRQWLVGVRTGAALRMALADDEDERRREEFDGVRERRRPHVRRAHWHSYWVGKGDARRLDVRWMPPIPINVTDPARLPIVVRDVGA